MLLTIVFVAASRFISKAVGANNIEMLERKEKELLHSVRLEKEVRTDLKVEFTKYLSIDCCCC